MTPSRWRHIEGIFQAALELQQEERRRFLTKACSGDAELRHEVELLLAQEASKLNTLSGSTNDRVEQTTATVATLALGSHLGPYKIESRVGAGGMGEVFRAVDTRLGRAVAIKFSKGQFSERLKREARAIAALNHPNICTLYDVGPNYLVMEFVDGVRPQGPLPWEEALKYALQICDALDAAHSRGIVHKDLKPGNILIAGTRVKLLDFGLAKMLVSSGGADDQTQSLELTLRGEIVGTPGYMAPEQIEGNSTDQRSDIWAFGAVLYEMLTGARAFNGASLPAVLAAVLREQPEPVSKVNPGVPSSFDLIVARCLEKSPVNRFTSVQEVKIALERVVSPSETIPSIAVLPFANLSADKENEYFGDGLAEEIINALTQVPGLRVIARTSAFAFRETQEDVRQIARALCVTNVLQGSVRRAGSRIRVTAQLVTGIDATQVWSHRYDKEMSDVFAVQDEIAQAVVDALGSRLVFPVGKQITQRQTASLDAYHLYVKGRHHFYKFEADIEMARRFFEEALAADSSYAAPFVDLAHYYWVSTMTRRISPVEGATNGIQAAEKALARDSTLGDAVGLRARFRALYEYRWDIALKDLERATELNPASALTSQGHAVVLTAMNRLTEAVQKQDHALKADPFSVLNHYFMARLLVCLGAFEGAGKHAAQAVELGPHSWLANSAVGLVHFHNGKYDEAVHALDKVKEEAPIGFISSGWRGCAYLRAGERKKAEQLLRQLQETKSPVPAAMIYALLGETNAAFDELEAAVRAHDFQLYNVQVESAFDNLRSHSRYRNLLQLMRLPEH